MKKIVLAGPPRSGKSCLREGLKQALIEIEDAPYPYVITACPDGEGAWFQEAVKNDPGVAKACKDAYKGEFTPEFVRLAAGWVRDSPKDMFIMVDVGGIVGDANREICQHATHIVIIAGDEPKTGQTWCSRMDEWRRFAAELRLTVVAELFSDYHGARDVVEGVGSDNILRGSIHRLERGEDIAARPMIQALARHLLAV